MVCAPITRYAPYRPSTRSTHSGTSALGFLGNWLYSWWFTWILPGLVIAWGVALGIELMR
jgi:hypothetical protein